MRLLRGTVVLVDLDPTVGHEQKGRRPCVVVSSPHLSEDQRYPLVSVVPVTRTGGEGLLYPLLEPQGSGLRERSYALGDQVRSVDKSRVRVFYGQVSTEELRAIDLALSALFWFPPGA